MHRHHAFDGIAFFKLPRRIICADGPFDFGLYSLNGVIDAFDFFGQSRRHHFIGRTRKVHLQNPPLQRGQYGRNRIVQRFCVFFVHQIRFGTLLTCGASQLQRRIGEINTGNAAVLAQSTDNTVFDACLLYTSPSPRDRG